jgi:amino acid permease
METDAESTPIPGRNRKKRWEKDHILSEIENQNRQREQEKVPRHLFFQNLSRALSLRVVQFFFFYLFVSLFLYAQDEGSSSGVAVLKEIYPLQILTFAAAVFSINAATTCFVRLTRRMNALAFLHEPQPITLISACKCLLEYIMIICCRHK